MVQVDEDRVALIGGINDDDTEVIFEVDIYDFASETWDSSLT